MSISLNTDEYVTQVKSGSMITTNEGRVFVCGHEQSYKFLLSSNAKYTTFFELSLSGLNSTETVSYASTHSYATFLYTDEGNLYAAGSSVYCGTNNSTQSNSFTECVFETGHGLVGNPVYIDRIKNSSFLVTDEGYMYVTGSPNFSQTTYPSQTLYKWQRLQTADGVYIDDVTAVSGQDTFSIESEESNTVSSFPLPLICDYNTTTNESNETVLFLTENETYDSSMVTTLNVGFYKINNIPSTTPLALINSDQQSSISYLGTALSSESTGPDGSTNYKFYYDTLYIQVDSSFTELSFYTTASGGSYLGSQNKIKFDESITHSNITVDSQSAVSNTFISDSILNIFKRISDGEVCISLSETDDISGNVKDTYNIDHAGTFTIKDIPPRYPLAFVGTTSESITIEGDESKMTTQTINDTEYEFYHGDISFTVLSTGFGDISFVLYDTVDSSYEFVNQLTYDPSFVSTNSSTSAAIDLSFVTSMFAYQDSDDRININFSESDLSNGNYLDTYEVPQNGIYEIKNIPNRFPLHLSVSSGSNVDISASSNNISQYYVDGVSTDFYTNSVYVKVGDNDEDIQLVIKIYDTLLEKVYESSTSITIPKNIDSSGNIIPRSLNTVKERLCLNLNIQESIESHSSFTVLDLHPTIMDVSEYTQEVDFGLAENQTYIIEAPSEYPLAFIGTKNQNDISYSGYSENIDSYVDIDGVSYPLYSSPLFITLNSNIDPSNTFTFYTKNGYDLNTMSVMKYDDECSASLQNSTLVVPSSESHEYYVKMILRQGYVFPRFDISSEDIEYDNDGKDVFYSQTTFEVESGMSYKFNQIPPWYPITVLNDGLSDKITLTGDNDKTVTADVSGISYSFYFGDVALNVYDTSFGDISGVSLYTSHDGGIYVGQQNMITVKEEESYPNNEKPLDQISRVSVVDDSLGNKKYVLNGRNLYVSDHKLGFTIGTYVFTNIPENYAMAVMNNGKESVIEYSGDSLKGVTTGPDGNTYKFYHGSLTMQVKSIDGILDEYISICSYGNGYMGGNSMLLGMDESEYNIMEQDVSFNNYPFFSNGFEIPTI